MPTLPTTTGTTDTKTALLDAAEKLFAASGIAESSLRAITAEAGANLASVSYHFGSKEGLVEAVFSRRLEPLNARRLELLRRCRSSRAAVGPELGCLLRAFVEPAVEMLLSDDPGDREFIKLLGHTLFARAQELRALVRAEFREVGERFTEALADVFPQTPREEILWRFHFMVGSLAHTVAGRYMVSHRLATRSVPDDDDPQLLTERLVGFLESGWLGLAKGTAAVRPSIPRPEGPQP